MTVESKKLEMPSHYPRDGRSPEEVIKDYLSRSEKLSAATRSKHASQLKIGYGKDEMESLDCFYPGSYNAETDVVVFVHGGYWQETNNALHHFVADQIVQSGKIAVLIETQNAPQACLTEIVGQCRRGLAAVAARFPQARSLVLSGHSSGAHKVFMMLACDWARADSVTWNYLGQKLRKVVLLCGVFETSHLLKSELNDLLKMTREEAHANNPILFVEPFAKNIKSCLGCRLYIVSTQYDAATITAWNSFIIREIGYFKPNMEVMKVEGHDHFSVLLDCYQGDFAVTKLLTE